jgi:hypothetical protein
MSDNQPQVVRSLQISDDSVRQRAGEIIRALEGVEAVEAVGQELRISYDFSHTSWAKVCEALKSAGLYAPRGVFTRWRDSWREFQDQNMRENLGHRAACCSKPPPGAGRR